MKRRTALKGLAALSATTLLPAFAKTTQIYDVIVIGAGLSGLISAYHLERSGYKVLVLEARNRVGGRILTLNNLPWQPEAGGQQIGMGYGYMRTLAAQFDLPLGSLGDFARNTRYLIGGQQITPGEWPQHPLNKLDKHEKDILPSRLYFHYLRNSPALAYPSDWTLGKHADLDRSMEQHLRELGASDMAIHLMNANLNANNLAQLSAADASYRLALAMTGGRQSHRIEGGNSLLTDRLAANIKSDIHLCKPVSRISDKDKVTIHCADGSRFVSGKCIVTVPFSVLREMEIDGAISPPKRHAIRQTNYTQISQVHFSVQPGIDKSDPIFSNIWSDSAFGRVFTSANTSGQVQSMLCWINGDAAIRLDKLKPQDAIRLVQQSIESGFPELKGKIVAEHFQSWGNEAYSRGAYAHFGPGQVQSFVPIMANAEGNLHFAGEHTEFDYPGMESALVSGMRAVSEIKELSKSDRFAQ